MSESSNKIRKIIIKITGIIDITEYDLLKDKGVSSLNLLSVLAALENTFGIDIPGDELKMSNFESIVKLNELVTRLIEKNKI